MEKNIPAGKLENQADPFKQDIESVKADSADPFEDLYAILERYGVIRDSLGEISSQQIIDHIEDMRDLIEDGKFKGPINKIPGIDLITKNGGLRAKVRELLQTEMGGEAVTFDSAEAMNTEGFVEFLAEFDDAETFDGAADEETLETRFGAFRNKQEASSKLSKIFNDELKSQGLGIEFGDDKLEAHIGERVEEMAHENPEKVKEIFEAVTDFEALGKQIQDTEKKIAELVGQGDLAKALEELNKKKETLETAAESVGHAGGGLLGDWAASLSATYEKFRYGSDEKHSSARHQKEARIATQDEYMIKPDAKEIRIALDETDVLIKMISEEIDALKKLEEEQKKAKVQFADIRSLLLAGVGTNEQLKRIAKKKAVEKLTGLMSTDPDKAQTFLESMEKASEENSFGIDYLGRRKKEFQKDIEENLDKRIKSDMKNVIERTPFGPKAYDNLAKSLEAFIGRTKIGTKEGTAARAFVMDTLKDIATTIGSKDKARGLLVRFLITRLSATAK